jgi:hypothetical protein
MTKAQAANCAKSLGGNFPTMTKDQLGTFAESIGNYHVDDVVCAMKNHFLTHAFCDMPQLINGINALDERRYRRNQKQESQRIIDWLRETQPVSYPASMSDQEAILTHFSTCWQGVKECEASDYGKQFSRRHVWSCCVAGLREVKVDQEAAETLARACVEMEAGEAFTLPKGGLMEVACVQ